MSEGQQLQRVEHQAVEKTGETSMLSIIARAASDPSVDVTKMERLMAMQERLVAREAELAFNAAMRDVQSKIRYVQHDAQNSNTNSSYSRLETINAAVTPVATEHGFSLSFGTADCPIQDHYRITCDVMHHAGHTRRFQCDVPLDMLGAKGNASKTRTHGFGSSLTYGRRYLTLLIFNIATGKDDDGNAAGTKAQEGPEVLIGLRAILWQLLQKHGKVQKGQTWDAARQWLVDENVIGQDEPINELSSDGFRRAISKATKILEGSAP